MNDYELTKTIYDKISEALKIERLEQECLVKHFRLVKVILPTDVMEELRKLTKETIKPNLNSVEGIVATCCSIPIEEDKCARKIRYVIEGELICVQ